MPEERKDIPADAAPDDLAAINLWLSQFDECPLECDGLTSVIHAALTMQGFKVGIGIGRLTDGSRAIPHHWIVANDSYIIDLRARMWFPQYGAHGIFKTQDQSLKYEVHGVIERAPLPPHIFLALAGFTPDTVSRLTI